MLRFTIQGKVFFTTFALAAAMAALLLGLTRWNLGQGFSRYVVEAEIGRLDWLVKNIEDAYAQNGNWDFLRGGREPWDRIVARTARADVRPPRPPRGANPGAGDPPPPGFEGRPPPPGSPTDAGGWPADLLSLYPLLSIRDASGQVLAGNPRPEGLAANRPIHFQGLVVGSLTLQAAGTEEARDAAFLATQMRNLWLSGLAALLLSLVAAWLLAHHLLRPIKALAMGARQIAEGRFSVRIPVRQNDELGELASDFNAMAEMLARTEEFRRQWISDSSHELRTPIAVLRAEIEALQDGVRTADEKTLVRLLRHVLQMSKLVDDLRQTLDRDDGQTSLELASIKPLAVLRETLEEFHPRLAVADLALDTSALPQPDPGWRIHGDAERLHQVFANLLENTLRYTHPGGRLKIAATVQAGNLRLQFDDTPPAPPEQAMPRLFDRFFRAEPSRSRLYGGSGLGLAICKTIVQGHGGTIAASTSALGGLCIRITLPRERRDGDNQNSAGRG
ncbi:MAG: HAMP domain-containing protein [Candidatus Competibacter sp.]|nr:HAMP domain-containing protein [Candidatus Competibacter sp.]MDG4605772.1 ATP-binding protein [Candidatus Contendobacter sp.]HRD48586.1 ATP-binding protein [Candidatus Contendobacter sp.]